MGRKPFHSPFADLKRKLARRPPAPATILRVPEVGPVPRRKGPVAGPAGPVPDTEALGALVPDTVERPPTDEDLWAQAIAGVSRIDPGPGIAGSPPPSPGPRDYWHPDFDAIDELRALVEGDGHFDLADSDEFVEGWVEGLDPAVVRKLRRGEYAVQGHVDLHGMRREEAKAAVHRFFRDARATGKRCVLLVHGRGTHSKDQVPVLKEALRTWLSAARFGRHVLAFATARPQDGGAGAVYVLLRRAGR